MGKVGHQHAQPHGAHCSGALAALGVTAQQERVPLGGQPKSRAQRSLSGELAPVRADGSSVRAHHVEGHDAQARGHARRQATTRSVRDCAREVEERALAPRRVRMRRAERERMKALHVASLDRERKRARVHEEARRDRAAHELEELEPLAMANEEVCVELARQDVRVVACSGVERGSDSGGRSACLVGRSAS